MDKYLHTSFSALGDPTRLAVVDRLMRGPASVSDLAQDHAMALPTFTKHLGILERAELIRSEKTGRVRSCAIHPPALRDIETWFRDRRALWEARHAALDDLIAKLNGDSHDR